ncbi:MAG: GTPase Era [Kiritimatiellae bacterium]|nr:GTPase Era [Kiritimatiellia bacterium]
MQENADNTVHRPKTAVLAVVGRTNAGKSTLVNNLVGEKVSIVSPVEQTTRNTVRGIVADARGQLVLLDTPGLHKAVGRLGTLLNRMARRSAAGADILAVVFDASQTPQLEDRGWMERVAREKPDKTVFILNKSDRKSFAAAPFHEAWKEAKEAAAGESGPAVEPVWVESAATEAGGAEAVLDAFFSLAEEGELLFPEDVVTDYPRRLAIADTIREKFLVRLHQEIPHELGVLVNEIEETPECWRVKADLIVNRQSQKPIVIGRGGEGLKTARRFAERELRRVFGVKVALSLWVRVEPGWMKNEDLLMRMGYIGDVI